MPTLNQSWVAGEQMLPRLIVRQDSSSPRQILLATLGDNPIGVTHEGTVYAPIPEVSVNPAVLLGDSCHVYGPDEECEVDVGAIAITAGDYVAPDDNSEAQPAVHGFQCIGQALDDSAANGKVRIKVLVPHTVDKSGIVLIKATDYTVTLADLGKVLTNTGAVATVTLTLPPALPGYVVTARVDAVQELRLDPDGTEQICLPSTGVPGVAGKYLTANALNEGVTLKCNEAGIWDCVTYTGTWTAEA